MLLLRCVPAAVLISIFACSVNPDDKWFDLNEQGVILGHQGKWEDAAKYLELAAEYAKSHFRDKDWRLAYSFGSLAFANEKLGNNARAGFLFDRSIEIYESAGNYDTLQYSTVLLNAARFDGRIGEYEEGGQYLYRSLALRKLALGEANDKVAEVSTELGFYHQGVMSDSAEFYLTKAVDIYSQLNPRPNRELIIALVNLARAKLDLKKSGEIYKIAARVDSLSLLGSSPSLEDQATMQYAIANANLIDSSYSESITEAQKGLDLLRFCPEDKGNLRGRILSVIAWNHDALNEYSLAAQYLDSCIAIENSRTNISQEDLSYLWIHRSRMERVQGRLETADSILSIVLAIPDEKRVLSKSDFSTECLDLASAYASKGNLERASALRRAAKNP